MGLTIGQEVLLKGKITEMVTDHYVKVQLDEGEVIDLFSKEYVLEVYGTHSYPPGTFEAPSGGQLWGDAYKVIRRK